MDKKNNLRKIIAESNIIETLKVFLLLNIDKFDDSQIEWLNENLQK